jgi:hypothetical protein
MSNNDYDDIYLLINELYGKSKNIKSHIKKIKNNINKKCTQCKNWDSEKKLYKFSCVGCKRYYPDLFKLKSKKIKKL